MKNSLLLIFSVVAFMTLAISCNRNNGPEDIPAVEDGYHAIARMSVPCGTREVMVESYTLDSKGNKAGVAYQSVPVTPNVETPVGGKDVEPFGEVTLLLTAPNKTLVSVYYTVSGTVAEVKSAANEDRTHLAQYVVDRLPVDQPGKGVTTKAGEIVPVYLPEPAKYETADIVQTVYQSSGVVMFEDSWPNLSGNINDDDYNDVVVDYDVTAEVVSDSYARAKTEQLKVVLHVRAVSGDQPHRVGMVLEGFDMRNVESVLEYKTLDSFASGHGELPGWTNVTLQENSLHYDPLATEYPCDAWDRPAIEIGKIDILNNSSRGAGTETYIYHNNEGDVEHVMNPALRQYSAWGGEHKEQYSPELPADVLKKAQNTKYYNVVPGYVNVAGGLYTYTVIYHMKPRAEMGAVEREAAKQNMIEAVMNNMAQNFFVVKKDFAPIGLKGYQPLDYKTKDNHVYANEYTKFYKQNSANLNADIPYVGANGQVWAFKCPVLTRHTWERMYFSNAYPHFKEWVLSNGAEAQDWYKRDVDYTYLTCQW